MGLEVPSKRQSLSKGLPFFGFPSLQKTATLDIPLDKQSKNQLNACRVLLSSLLANEYLSLDIKKKREELADYFYSNAYSRNECGILSSTLMPQNSTKN